MQRKVKKLAFGTGIGIVLGFYFDILYIHFNSVFYEYKTIIETNRFGEWWLEALLFIVGLILFFWFIYDYIKANAKKSIGG